MAFMVSPVTMNFATQIFSVPFVAALMGVIGHPEQVRGDFLDATHALDERVEDGDGLEQVPTDDLSHGDFLQRASVP